MIARIPILMLALPLSIVAAKPVGADVDICLDPGHGGLEGSAACRPAGYCCESKMNFNLAQELIFWIDYGSEAYTYVATKSTLEEDILPSERAQIGNDNNATIFVSIHHNSSTVSRTLVIYQDDVNPELVTNHQREWWPESKELAACIANGVCMSFSQARGLTCRGECITNVEPQCAGELSYGVLSNSNRPAVIGEGPGIQHPTAEELCTYPSQALIDQAEGYYEGIRCYLEANTATRFTDAGAFADTAYCESVDERNSVDLALIGFTNYPHAADTLAIIAADGGPRIIRRYVAELPAAYPLLQWLERDLRGTVTRSDTFCVSGRPAGWSSWYGTSHTYVDSSAFSDTLEIGISLEALEDEPTTEVCATCADIVVYSSDTSLYPHPAQAIYDQIALDSPNAQVRLVIGQSSSADDCADAIYTIWNANKLFNDFCENNPGTCTRTFPESPGPELYIVGDQIPQGLISPVPWVAPAAMTQPSRACVGMCRSDYLLYDFDGDLIPEGPVSRIPIRSSADAILAAQYAHEYNTGQFVDPGNRILFLMGDVDIYGGFDPRVEPYFNSIASEFTATGSIVRPWLRDSEHNFIEGRALAKDAIEEGIGELFAFGGSTLTDALPSRFVQCHEDFPASLQRKQRFIGWYPGCDLHSIWKFDYDRYCSVASGLMFNDSESTCMVAGVSHMDGGWSFRHQAIGKYLAAQRRDALLGSEQHSVARVVYDAIWTAANETPTLRDHALSVSTWGSYVRLGVAPQCASVVVPSYEIVGCPGGDGDALEITAALACGFDLENPDLSVYATCSVDPPGSVWAWDDTGAGGVLPDAIEGQYDSETHIATFTIDRISGCGTLSVDVYVEGMLVAKAIQFTIRSYDFDPQTIGAVDPGDSTAFGPALLAENPCVDFDLDGNWGPSDQTLFLDHQPHAGHHIARKLTVPDVDTTWYPQEVNGIYWVPGQGPNSTVSLYYYRDSDPTLHQIVDHTTDDGHYTWQLPADLTPGTDYRVKLVHRWTNWPDWASDLGRDISDIPFEVGDPGCPYVQTWAGSEWKLENSILARSAESVLSQDAYLIKSDPDRSGGRLTFRILENADEFTTLDRVAVAALDVAEGSKVLRVSDRYIAGTWEPATRVVKVSGEEITHLTDGSRAEYYVGAPGETLLVDLPLRKAIPGVEGEGRFPTSQGGGGSGGSGGGKGIDPAPEGPPDLTTSGLALDKRYLTETGILVQFRNGNGDWETAQHWYPRERFDDFVVDGFTEGQMRLIILGKHKLRYLGRFNYSQDGVTPKAARLLSASHTRLGDQLSTVQGADESATIIAPGDTVTFEFETVAPEAGKTRHWFLVTNGVYSSAAPQGYDAYIEPPPAPTYAFALGAARPNPTSGNVRIDYTLAHESNVSMRIYNVAGRLVRDLVRERQKTGPYNLTWNLRDNGGVQVPSGVYFYRLVADEWTSEKKVVLIDR